jgi:hypothetical protein
VYRHDLAGLPGAEDHAHQVDLDDLTYHRDRSVREVADVNGGSGVVHHARHHSELAGRDGEQSFYVVLAGDIGLGQDAPGSGGPYLGGGLLRCAVVLPVGQGEVVARLGQPDSGCCPDTAASPGDDGDGPVTGLHCAATSAVPPGCRPRPGE